MPIPGTTKQHRLSENNAATDVDLTVDDLSELTAASDLVDTPTARYPDHMQQMIDR